MNYERVKKVIVSLALMCVFAFSTLVANVVPANAQGYQSRYFYSIHTSITSITDTSVGLGSSTGRGSKIREAKRRWNDWEWGPQSLTPPLPNSEGAVPDVILAEDPPRS